MKFEMRFLLLTVLLFACAGGETDESGAEDASPIYDDLVDNDTDSTNCIVYGGPDDSSPQEPGSLSIMDVGELSYEPNEIETVRPDLFQPGHFSPFDVLVHLHRRGEVELDYHFDEETDTHLIDSLNGHAFWMYYACHDKGILLDEDSHIRMDTYPVKDRTTILLAPTTEEEVSRLRHIWRDEVLRREANGGSVVIPEVSINFSYGQKRYKNVEVTAHNYRGDFFVEGTITVLDVIASMKADGLLEKCFFRFYDSIGTAQVVQDYFVDQLDDDLAYKKSGFLYHINPWWMRIAADIHVIHSPEFVGFQWSGVEG